MANLSNDDVLKLARLARISLSDEEVSRFTEEFGAILEYVKQLEAVDVSGLLPTSQVTGLTNVMRDDVVRGYGYDQATLLENVPTVQGDQIKVRRMIG
jgi:aspartyl-tRNA(Asn)/glutamyl-tRNA(Gln) amidotransferase subunit C